MMQFRPYIDSDKRYIFRNLSFLPNLYPNSLDWLEKSLSSVDQRSSFCHVACIGQRVVGSILTKLKTNRTAKICNIFVGDLYREKNVGTKLMNLHLSRLHDLGTEEAVITFDDSISASISPFLIKNEFAHLDSILNLYGPDRREFIYGAKIVECRQRVN